MSKKPSIDGFVPRRSQANLGDVHAESKLPPVQARGLQRRTAEVSPELIAEERATTNALASSGEAIRRGDVDESLRSIDESPQPEQPKKHRRGLFRRRGDKKPVSRRRKIIKRLLLLLLVIGIGIGLWVGISAILASGSMFKGDIFGIVQQKKLKVDENGRSNVLIFGTNEDDEGGDHPGAMLTDSIMVLSISQDKKDAYMISIPRDLWVNFGAACNAGYQGKINELYNCFSDGGTSKEEKEAGALALAKEVGEVTGLDVQYYAHLNYTVVRQAVDAVGGVTVKVESSDPRGIYDPNFDWKCNYQCNYVKYKNGEVANMDGEHALAFMRARNAQGGYGLPGGNFDREKNQQKVIKALREKALSAGTLANPGKVTSLINAMGDNLSTSFETSEIRTLISLAQDIKAEAIQSISLVDENEPVMTTGNVGGASIVRPIAGVSDFSQVQSYINKQINATPVTREAAHVIVLNASGVPGAAQLEADKLESKGLIVDYIGNAEIDPAQAANQFYAVGDATKEHTTKYLAGRYNTRVKTTTPPGTVYGTTNFVVVIVKPIEMPATN